MTTQPVHDLPPKFVKTITGMFGRRGRHWLDMLPVIAGEISANWSLKIERPLANLSYHFVAPCVCADGSEAILKIGPPEEKTEFYSETGTLRLYDGDGAVRLLRTDEKRYAMLLEKLVPGKTLGETCLENDAETVRIAAGILKKIVRPAPDGHGFHKLDDWMGGFRKAKNTVFPADITEKARSLYRELSAKNKKKFLLHGDFHHENILSSRRAPYLVIDPKGLIGDVGYDAGVFLNNHRDWLEHLPDVSDKLDDAIGQFAAALETAKADIRKWAFIQATLSAWWAFEENDENWCAEVSKADAWQV
jgi:streptomycin 6-kinase